MHFYTSICQNYLPKARILAQSVKLHCPNSYFSLVVSDALPENFDLSREPFDEVVYIDELEVPTKNLQFWIYTHTVVEICTAVKGQALCRFLNAGHSDKVVYLDPDTVVYDDLKELECLLDQHDVVLTPHLTAPEKTLEGVLDNEVSTLMHGIYNLGFVAVKNTENGLLFASWWRDRLVALCYDDIPRGIFTDQSWVDMAPAIFDGVYILRSPAYNVSTWNISNRKVTRGGNNYLVNGLPLQFYHFSGFDSGAQEKMLNKWGNESSELNEMRSWYIEQQNINGQQELGKKQSIYACYSNGEKIQNEHRVLLRSRNDLIDYFGAYDPFDVDAAHSWYAWLQDAIAHDELLTDEQREIKKLTQDLQKSLSPEEKNNFMQQIEMLHQQIANLECTLESAQNQNVQQQAQIDYYRKWLFPLIKLKRMIKR